MRTVATDAEIGAGDCKLVRGFINNAGGMVEALEREVQWQEMRHRGGVVPRLVAVQADIGADGSYPVYRHPADELPATRAFSSTVERIRREVERAAGHSVNHVLIQLYRDGGDYISEHADKTLDIARGSYIVNVSFGAERYMVLRRKDKANRDAHKLLLEDNSALLFGLETNRLWLHGIRQNRQVGGPRISLTFRHIDTFVRPTNAPQTQRATCSTATQHATCDTATQRATCDIATQRATCSTATCNNATQRATCDTATCDSAGQMVIWGKGATQGEASLARPAQGSTESLLWAFRTENQTSADSAAVYSGGWDAVL